MKIGRNDPCHCGSGKKYKKCCLNNEVVSQEFSWKKTHQMRNELIDVVVRFALQKYGQESIFEAWDEFNCWDDNSPEFNPESHQNQVFMPWFLYDWTPDPEATTVVDDKYHGIAIGQSLLNSKTKELSLSQIEYIEKCLEAPFSFFEILESRKGEGYQLKDLFTFEEHNVVEKMGSKSTQDGDMLFGKLVTIEGVTTLEGCSPFVISPSMKLPILELRNHIKKANSVINNEVLKKYNLEFLALYQNFHDSILGAKRPKICNTDGDDMILQKLIYQIGSLEDTFEKLQYLDIVSTKEELLNDAVAGEHGKLKKLEFSWCKKGNKKHKSWENTILGHIELNENKMIISVNSNERAEKIKKIVSKALKGIAVYKNTVIEDLTSLAKRKVDNGQQDNQKNDLMNAPEEIQEKMKAMIKDHWSNWIDEKNPALGGKTPKQAARNKDGRELLQGLLIEIERKGAIGHQAALTMEIFRQIREDLGIQKEESISLVVQCQ